jgi:Tol biopolymer transport system component
MTRRSTGFLAAMTVLTAGALTLAAQDAPLGPFDDHADIGAPKIAGTARYDAGTQRFALSAGGVNMWAGRDEFQFVWKRLNGDFILQTRVAFVGAGTDPHRKAGLVIRPSQDDDAPYIDVVVHGDGLTSMQFRRTKGGATEEQRFDLKAADVLQIERRGGTFIASAAKFGEPFAVQSIADLDLGDAVLGGLALCAHDPEVREQATFSNVRLTRPAKPDFRPYRDFIGSVLELLDVETGDRQEIYRSSTPFEAPNWTRDGKALIYNQSGRAEGWGGLYRFDLARRQPTLIDTGTANRNNNDHVLSFDGTMLAISDQSQGSGGRSTVYTVPVTGGTPKRITTASPSYAHGWSPDGRYIVFTGGRDNEFDIYRIPADGSGPEEKLTTVAGLDDGPEYSPDGRYIYFNSVRGGKMDIWRMRADGSAPEPLTNDALQNWFPHLSPDGRWVVMISFPSDVPAGEHPYYKHVYLRLMPADGGTPRVLAYVYGGQGTINVPSWSPDGRRLAFVSNTDAF